MPKRWNKNPPKLLPCWDHFPAAYSDPKTSHIAAVKSLDRINRQCQEVLAALKGADGSTSDELANAAAGLNRYATARRLSDLRHQGLVRQGEARLSKVSKRLCVTWWVQGG